MQLLTEESNENKEQQFAQIFETEADVVLLRRSNTGRVQTEVQS